MPGDRGLAFVIIGSICAIGLWIGSVRTVAHPAKAVLVNYNRVNVTLPRIAVIAPRLQAANAMDDESKARLAEELGLTPLD